MIVADKQEDKYMQFVLESLTNKKELKIHYYFEKIQNSKKYQCVLI